MHRSAPAGLPCATVAVSTVEHRCSLFGRLLSPPHVENGFTCAAVPLQCLVGLAVLGGTATVQAHAENDVDRRAIDALRRAVEVDPQNLDALLALGVSYTNELDQATHTPARSVARH